MAVDLLLLSLSFQKAEKKQLGHQLHQGPWHLTHTKGTGDAMPSLPKGASFVEAGVKAQAITCPWKVGHMKQKAVFLWIKIGAKRASSS